MRQRTTTKPPAAPSPELGAVLRHVLNKGTNRSSEGAAAVLGAVLFLAGLFAAGPVHRAVVSSGAVSAAASSYAAVLDGAAEIQADAYRTLGKGVLAAAAAVDSDGTMRNLPAAVAETFEQSTQTIGEAIAVPFQALKRSADETAYWYLRASDTVSGRLGR